MLLKIISREEISCNQTYTFFLLHFLLLSEKHYSGVDLLGISLHVMTSTYFFFNLFPTSTFHWSTWPELTIIIFLFLSVSAHSLDCAASQVPYNILSTWKTDVPGKPKSVFFFKLKFCCLCTLHSSYRKTECPKFNDWLSSMEWCIICSVQHFWSQ